MTRLVGQFGVALGGVAIARNAFGVVRDFGQAQADLTSVLGESSEALKKQSLELGSSTTFTASQVAELQKELAKLGFDPTEIENATEATLSLAEATGTDLARAAEVTGATVRGFGLDTSETGRVVDVMAKSFSSSSLDMEKFATAMRSVAPVARTAGLDIEKTTALLGTLTDRGLDASTAGTSLRNVFLELSNKGLTFEQAMKKINDASDKNATAMELFGKRGATTGVILSETSEDVENLTEKLNDAEGAAQDMADTQRNTLDGALKLLQSAWEGYILGADGSSGASKRLQEIIEFLADNLVVILDTIIRLTRAFVIFKTVLFLTNKVMLPLIKGFKAMAIGAKGMATGTKSATTAFKGMNAAMKANIIAFVAVAVIELVDALDLFTSSAEKAQAVLDGIRADEEAKRKEALENQNKFLSAAAKLRANEVQAIDRQIRRIQLLNVSEKEKERLLQEQLDIKREIYNEDAENIELRKEDVKTQAKENRTVAIQGGEFGFSSRVLSVTRDIKENQKIIEALTEQREALSDTGGTDARTKFFSLGKDIQDLQETNVRLQEVAKTEQEQLNLLTQEELRLKNKISDLDIDDLERTSKKTKTKEKSSKRELTALEKLQKELKALEKQRENLVSRDGDINDPETWRKTNEQIEVTEKKIREILIVLDRIKAKEAESVDDFLSNLDEKYEEAEEKRKADAAQRFDNLVQENLDELKFIELNLLKQGKSREEINKVIQEEEIRLLKERIELFKANGEEVIDLELELARKQKEIEDKKRQDQIDSYKSLIKSVQSLLETLTGIISRQIDKQMEKFTQQVDASKERQSELRELALQGNEDAKKSLQQEEKNEAEALSKKAQAEKRKAQLEKTSIILESIGNLVGQGLSIPEATAQSLTAYQLVETALKGLDSFLVGTEDTGKKGSLDSNGGRLAILHDNERVMTKEQNKMVGNMSNWELATMAGQYQSGELNSPSLDVAKAQLNVFDTSKLESKIDNLTETVANKPVQNWRVESISDDLKEYVESIHKNGKVTNNRFRKWRK